MKCLGSHEGIEGKICAVYERGIGNLDEYTGNEPVAEDIVRVWARQIVSGLIHLKQHDIVHRDIKLANILVFEVEGKVLLKICDFGTACKVTQPGRCMTICGTPPCWPPEMFRLIENYQQNGGDASGDADKVSTLFDVFSLGIVLLELISGGIIGHSDAGLDLVRPAWTSINEQFKHVSTEAKAFLELALCSKDLRATVEDLAQHAFLTDVSESVGADKAVAGAGGEEKVEDTGAAPMSSPYTPGTVQQQAALPRVGSIPMPDTDAGKGKADEASAEIPMPDTDAGKGMADEADEASAEIPMPDTDAGKGKADDASAGGGGAPMAPAADTTGGGTATKGSANPAIDGDGKAGSNNAGEVKGVDGWDGKMRGGEKGGASNGDAADVISGKDAGMKDDKPDQAGGAPVTAEADTSATDQAGGAPVTITPPAAVPGSPVAPPAVATTNADGSPRLVNQAEAKLAGAACLKATGIANKEIPVCAEGSLAGSPSATAATVPSSNVGEKQGGEADKAVAGAGGEEKVEDAGADLASNDSSCLDASSLPSSPVETRTSPAGDADADDAPHLLGQILEHALSNTEGYDDAMNFIAMESGFSEIMSLVDVKSYFRDALDILPTLEFLLRAKDGGKGVDGNGMLLKDPDIAIAIFASLYQPGRNLDSMKPWPLDFHSTEMGSLESFNFVHTWKSIRLKMVGQGQKQMYKMAARLTRILFVVRDHLREIIADGRKVVVLSGSCIGALAKRLVDCCHLRVSKTFKLNVLKGRFRNNLNSIRAVELVSDRTRELSHRKDFSELLAGERLHVVFREEKGGGEEQKGDAPPTSPGNTAQDLGDDADYNDPPSPENTPQRLNVAIVTPTSVEDRARVKETFDGAEADYLEQEQMSEALQKRLAGEDHDLADCEERWAVLQEQEKEDANGIDEHDEWMDSLRMGGFDKALEEEARVHKIQRKIGYASTHTDKEFIERTKVVAENKVKLTKLREMRAAVEEFGISAATTMISFGGTDGSDKKAQ